jgi:hypothetical protein
VLTVHRKDPAKIDNATLWAVATKAYEDIPSEIRQMTLRLATEEEKIT